MLSAEARSKGPAAEAQETGRQSGDLENRETGGHEVPLMGMRWKGLSALLAAIALLVSIGWGLHWYISSREFTVTGEVFWTGEAGSRAATGARVFAFQAAYRNETEFTETFRESEAGAIKKTAYDELLRESTREPELFFLGGLYHVREMEACNEVFEALASQHSGLPQALHGHFDYDDRGQPTKWIGLKENLKHTPQTRTDAHGEFSLNLARGTYLLVAWNGDRLWASPVTVGEKKKAILAKVLCGGTFAGDP